MPTYKKVLFIAYLFPPSGGAGVQRTLKFVKFLPESGWQAVVLTVKENAVRLQDPGLIAELQPDNPIHRTHTFSLPVWLPFRIRRWVARWFLFVDEQIGWYPFALHQGLKLANGVQALYSTSAPYTDHLIGLSMKLKTGLPWIADFRDAWIGNFQNQFPTKLHQRTVQSLERQVVEAADRVLVVSEPVRSAFIARYPDSMPGKFVYLPNGFDPDDFAQTSSLEKQNDCFTITYTGSFYVQGRSPLPFFQGIETVLEQGSISRMHLRINLVGNIGNHVRTAVQELGLQDCIQFTGYLEHSKSISYLKTADVLLLLVGDGADSEALMPGKIFEYLAADCPILVLGPDGVAARLVLEAQAGLVAPANDVAAIARELTTLYRKWEQGVLAQHPRPEVVARYNRRSQAQQLAQILDEITPPQAVR